MYTCLAEYYCKSLTQYMQNGQSNFIQSSRCLQCQKKVTSPITRLYDVWCETTSDCIFYYKHYSSLGSTAGSNLSLMDSTANLSLYPNSADVAEQFGLHHLSPSPLHYTAIQGELKTHTQLLSSISSR